MDVRGQLSVDYMVAIIILGIVLLAIFTAYDNGEQRTLKAAEKSSMVDAAESLAVGINSVVIMGDGSGKNITLVNTTALGAPYNITIRKNLVLLRWGSSDYVARFSTAGLNITGNITPGRIELTNRNGTIYVRNIL